MAAETEAKPESTDIVGRDGGGRRDNPNPFFSFFTKFPLFNFPPLKRDDAKPQPAVPATAVGEYEEDGKPVVVKFRNNRTDLPSLKLEAEDSEQNTNPIVLWQVYAIGGFFILRWAISRWKERMAKKRSSSDEEPSPGGDQPTAH